MCWACYTPLTAGAGASMTAGAGMGGAGAATMPRAGAMGGVPGADDGSRKKQIDPRLYAVGGFLLVAALIGVFESGMFSGPPVDISTGGVDPTNITPMTNMSGSQPIPNSGSGGGGLGGGANSPGVSTSQPADTGPSFSLLTSPNPQYATATFAIAPSQSGVSPAQAVDLARKARQSMVASGKWKSSQIVVFSSADSAQAFRQYMNQRRGAPLAGGDFAALGQGTWSNVIVFYQTSGNSERPSYPSQNPTGWWGR